MGRLLRRAWRYLVAMLSGKLDEVSDPKVQIEQAIEQARQQHALLSQQAAAVIGNERELQLKLTRAVAETEKLQANARQALLLAEQARDAGDQTKAASYEDSARAFATKLVSAETAMKDLHAMPERAAQASGAGARRGRDQRPGLAEAARRADQAAVPARPGQDARAAQPGDGRHDRAGRPHGTPPASRRSATRSRAATPAPSARPSCSPPRSRPACSRSSAPPSTPKGRPASSRSGKGSACPARPPHLRWSPRRRRRATGPELMPSRLSRRFQEPEDPRFGTSLPPGQPGPEG